MKWQFFSWIFQVPIILQRLFCIVFKLFKNLFFWISKLVLYEFWELVLQRYEAFHANRMVSIEDLSDVIPIYWKYGMSKKVWRSVHLLYFCHVSKAIDFNMVCNTKLTTQMGGKCQCKPDMRWNKAAGECQVIECVFNLNFIKLIWGR